MTEQSITLLAAIGILGVACQWLSWWLKLPAILFLLLAGILIGPTFGWMDPDALFGDLLFPMVSLGVAVVLFEGSLSLQFHQVRDLASVVRNLVTVGVLITALVVGLATHWLLDLSWEISFLFAAIVTVTGPTVITPLLRVMRPTASIASILRWEGIIIDPLGAVLALLVFEYVITGQEGHAAATFLRLLGFGTVLGLAGAAILASLLRRRLLPDYLTNVATLSLLLGVFAVAHAFQEESGLLAVTVMGMTLANMRGVPIEEVIDFKESLSVMILSALFIILAARLDFAQLAALGWSGAAVLAVILFVARPLSVAVSTFGSRLDWRERMLLGWIAPRGIVAAAVSALFAFRLESEGMAEGSLLVPLTFAAIIGTVVLHSATARPLAGWLGVSEPEPKGLLIVGANRAARAVALALQQAGFRTVLADTHWEDIRAARMEGLKTYFGNAVSEHADRHLDLVGVGTLLAMTRRPAFNALACMRFRTEFGSNRVFAVRTPEEKRSEKTSIARPLACRYLFDDRITLAKLSSLLSKGAEIHTTLLTDDFDFESYQRCYRNKVIPLFALTPRGRLRIFTEGRAPGPEAGWSVIGLLPPEALDACRNGGSAEEEVGIDTALGGPER